MKRDVVVVLAAKGAGNLVLDARELARECGREIDLLARIGGVLSCHVQCGHAVKELAEVDDDLLALLGLDFQTHLVLAEGRHVEVAVDEVAALHVERGFGFGFGNAIWERDLKRLNATLKRLLRFYATYPLQKNALHCSRHDDQVLRDPGKRPSIR